MFMKFILCLQSDDVEMFHGIELAWVVMFKWTNLLLEMVDLDHTKTPVRQ